MVDFQEGIPLEVGDICIFQEGRIPILARLQEQNHCHGVTQVAPGQASYRPLFISCLPAQSSTRAMKSDRMTRHLLRDYCGGGVVSTGVSVLPSSSPAFHKTDQTCKNIPSDSLPFGPCPVPPLPERREKQSKASTVLCHRSHMP